MTFYFKNTNKDLIMTEEDEEGYRNKIFCRFCEKNIECDKVRDHCQLSGRYRGPAFNKCNLNVTRNKVFSFHFYFTSSVILIVICFFKKLVDQNNDKVNFDSIFKINEDYKSVTYGCVRFIGSYRFLSSSLDSLVKKLVDKNKKKVKKFEKRTC